MREEKDKGSRALFFPSAPLLRSKELRGGWEDEFKLFGWKSFNSGGEGPTEVSRFIKGNEQCHLPLPSLVTFGSAGLGLILTIWLQLQWPVEWRGQWNYPGFRRFKSVSISPRLKTKFLICSITLMWSQWRVWPGLVSISVDSEFMSVPWQWILICLVDIRSDPCPKREKTLTEKKHSNWQL